MKIMKKTVQDDRCYLCNQTVLTASYDVLGDVDDRIVLDPTPLSQEEQVACMVTDRNLYRIERSGLGYQVGRKHWATDDIRMNTPDIVLPVHRCRGRFASTLPAGMALELFATHLTGPMVQEDVSDLEPVWAHA